MDVYNTGNEDVQRDVLQAWLIAGRKEAVYKVALNAKTEDEANAAIRMLSGMGASDELRNSANARMLRADSWRHTRSAETWRACARSPKATATVPCASMP